MAYTERTISNLNPHDRGVVLIDRNVPKLRHNGRANGQCDREQY
jgi:hypothetical protein